MTTGTWPAMGSESHEWILGIDPGHLGVWQRRRTERLYAAAAPARIADQAVSLVPERLTSNARNAARRTGSGRLDWLLLRVHFGVWRFGL